MNIQIRKFYDCLSSYGYWSRTDEDIKEDEKGKYKEKHVTKEVPCSCHPETCCHFDGKKTISYVEKVYLNNTNAGLYTGWFSVVDKLPADGEIVLCFEERKCNQFVTQFLNREDGFQEEWYEKCACTIDGNNYDCKVSGCKGVFGRHPFVTHWMPLPPSPCV